MTALPTRPLGRTGLNVSILGLGCAPLGDLYDLLDDDVALNTVTTAAMDGAYRALDELRRAGVVKAIGVGVNESAMCARFANAGDIDTVLLAGRYSLLEQPALADFLPVAAKKGIGVMLGGVFNSGILATGAVEGAKYNYRPAPPEI